MDGDQDEPTLDYRRRGETDSNPNLTELEEKLQAVDRVLVAIVLAFVACVVAGGFLLIYAGT